MTGRTFFVSVIAFFAIQLSAVTGLRAQTCMGCTDPIYCPAKPGYSCPADYQPVCGCDGKTYRNPCVAYNRNGILQFTDGPCSGYDYDITPNTGSYELNMQIYRKDDGYAVIYIYDPFGNIKTAFPIYVPGANSTGGYAYQYQLDISFLPQGIYLLEVVFEGTKQVKKFLKYEQR